MSLLIRSSYARVLRAWVVVMVAAWVSVLWAGQATRGQTRRAAIHFQITGNVLNARDGSPLPHCHLTASLFAGSRGENGVTADTDDDGHFAMELPGAGNWQVTAQAHGFRTQSFEEHDGFFTGVVLTEASPTYRLTFPALPDGSVRGIVTDEAGEPVRNASVTLYSLHPEARTTGANRMQSRGRTQTDDRGHYTFASLESGEYQISVQASAWYAGRSASGVSSGGGPSLDPSLDVVYPLTWFPGVDDASSADMLHVHAGEVIQADFRLRPVASAHLLIPLPVAGGEASGGFDGLRGRVGANLSEVMPDGSLREVRGNYQVISNNQIDIGGLAPGTYRISHPGPEVGGGEQNAEVKIATGGSIAELSGATSEVSVTIAVDGNTSNRASEISLVDTETGRTIGGGFDGFRGDGGRSTQRGGQSNFGRGTNGTDAGRRRGDDSGGRGRRRSLELGDGKEARLTVPPGKYTVMVSPVGDTFLTGISAQGADTAGRVVTIQDRDAKLLIHLASGLAKISGAALMEGTPSVGAVVLLVPATLGAPSNLLNVRRDQTNTDGSFELEKIIPGQYILLAIDHGWNVNWSDAATLGQYLVRGMPLDLRAGASVRPTVQAVRP